MDSPAHGPTGPRGNGAPCLGSGHETTPDPNAGVPLRFWVIDGASQSLMVSGYLKLAKLRAAESDVVDGYYAKIEGSLP